MAEKVTGVIGQEDVVLENAATEATLLKLLKAMGSKGDGGSKGGGGEESKKQLAALAKQTGKTTKELEELEEAANNVGNVYIRGIGQIANAFKGLTGELLTGGDRISDFTSHVTGALESIPIVGGLIGGIGQLLISTIDNQIDTFRDLSKVGIDFGENLYEASYMATKTSLTMEQYQGVITTNAEMLAKLGGSAGNGAKAFTALLGNVSKNSQLFLQLGMTMEEVSEYTADYVTQQQRLGRGERLSSKQSLASAQAYIKEVDKLAKATGKQRDEISGAMNEVSNDKRLKGVMAGLDETARLAITSTVTMLSARDAELGEAVKEMIATGGVPISEMSIALSLLNPGIAAATKALNEGVPGAADMLTKEIEKARQTVLKMSKAELDSLAVRAAMGDQIALTTLSVLGLGNMVEAVTAADIEQEKKRKALEEGRAKKLLDFEQTITDTRNKMKNALIDSGIFDSITTVLNSITTKFKELTTKEGGLGKIESAAKSFGTVITNLMESFQKGTLMKDIGKYLSDGLNKLGELIAPHISTAMAGLMNIAKDVVFGKKKMEMAGPAGQMAATGEREGGALSSFLGLLAGPALLGGLGALGAILATGAVFLGFKALTTVFRMFANGPVAIGAAVFTAMLIGTGAAITLAGKGIDLAGDGVEKIAAGVEKMANMKGAANFAEIATSLGLLGPALISLTKGGVLESITSFFGSSSPFTTLVEGINQFEKIDATAIENVKLSGTALEGLSKFGKDLDVSNLKLYADQMERLGNAFEKMNDELTKDNSWIPFYKGSNAGNTTMPSGGGAGTGSSDQLTLLNTNIDKLLTETEAIRRNGKKLTDHTLSN
jgi:hypothetical protein